MAHEISTGPHPNLVVIRIYGELEAADLNVNSELGLGSGRPIYLLADLSRMGLGIPENFLDSARKSAFSHPDVKHTAVYLKSGAIAALAKAVSKLTRQQDKVTSLTSYEEAESHLLKLIRQAGL